MSGTFFFSLLTPVSKLKFIEAEENQGRVVEASIKLYDIPSFNGREITTYWKDTILPISAVTIGDIEPSYNRIWYRVEDKGYVHSGGIQPVGVHLNQPTSEVPDRGLLTEVTVPFTDAYWGPGTNHKVAYRLYYETTHWINGLSYDHKGQPWYRIIEDKWRLHYFVRASHLRIIPPEELGPLSPDVPSSAKRLEVHTAEQIVIAYEWDKPVLVAKTSTGAKFSNGDFLTPKGHYITAHKRPSRHMAAGNLAYNGYDLPGVPWISYITENGISLHGTYWHNDFGRPRSHGCINLTPKVAKWIYLWTLPTVLPYEREIHESYGTTVDVK